jgi:hypothetical protein
VVDSLDVSTWQSAGASADGREVRLPFDASDPLVAALFDAVKEGSREATDELAFPYATATEFLQDRAIMAIEFDEARWIVAISSRAEVKYLSCD